MDPNAPFSEMVRSHVSNMQTLAYNQENSFITKNAIILIIIHTIFNLHDTEVVICIVLVLLRRA